LRADDAPVRPFPSSLFKRFVAATWQQNSGLKGLGIAPLGSVDPILEIVERFLVIVFYQCAEHLASRKRFTCGVVISMSRIASALRDTTRRHCARLPLSTLGDSNISTS
jgi:hypothetical protein